MWSYRYLYKSNSPGVQDYLCNRLYALPEAGLEKYLSQLIQLIIIKPYGPLEKVVVDLCAKSLRIAVKVRCRMHLPSYSAVVATLLTSAACLSQNRVLPEGAI